MFQIYKVRNVQERKKVRAKYVIISK
jgi:hypothetical protein